MACVVISVSERVIGLLDHETQDHTTSFLPAWALSSLGVIKP